VTIDFRWAADLTGRRVFVTTPALAAKAATATGATRAFIPAD
jgi:hypothetical protein